jgi:hypothetical protein
MHGIFGLLSSAGEERIQIPFLVSLDPGRRGECKTWESTSRVIHEKRWKGMQLVIERKRSKGKLEVTPRHLEAEFEVEFVGNTHGNRVGEINAVKPASSWSNGSIATATKIETIIAGRGRRSANSQNSRKAQELRRNAISKIFKLIRRCTPRLFPISLLIFLYFFR